MLGDHRRRIERLEARLREQDRVIDELCRRAGLRRADLDAGNGASSQVSPEERDLIARDKFIHAVKAYRERTGAGLREAKDVIDAEQRRMTGRY